jgi:hypothetical protein
MRAHDAAAADDSDFHFVLGHDFDFQSFAKI